VYLVLGIAVEKGYQGYLKDGFYGLVGGGNGREYRIFGKSRTL
jgi:hypothetical protein